MKKAIVFILLTISSLTLLYGQRYVDIDKNRVALDKEKAIVLVTSTECGFCLKNTPFYNKISEKYAKKVQLIAMYETKKRAIEKCQLQFAEMGRDVTLVDWIVIPNAKSHYLPLVERETYPQMLFIKNGEVIKRAIGTIDSVNEEIENFIPQFLELQ